MELSQQMRDRAEFLGGPLSRIWGSELYDWADELEVLESEVERLRWSKKALIDAIEDALAHRGPDWASILRYALSNVNKEAGDDF